jgi:hypothetical protein
MKDEARRMKAEGVEPTAEAVAVVWPRAPEAERLSLLMAAKARPQKAELNKLKGRSAR